MKCERKTLTRSEQILLLAAMNSTQIVAPELIASFIARAPSGRLVSYVDGVKTVYNLRGVAPSRKLVETSRNGVVSVCYENASLQASDNMAEKSSDDLLDAIFN